jgi:hypothetical protein
VTSLEVLWVLSLPLAVLLGLVLVGSVGAGRGLTAAALAVGLFGLAGDLAMGMRQRDVSGWLPTPARVMVSERGRSANAWSFAYEYEVEGQRHRGSRVTIRPHLRGREDTDRMAARYPVGAELTVHRSPRDPSRSVIEREPSYALPLAAGVLHGALLAALARARRRRMETRST